MFLERRVRAASTGVAKQPLLTGCDASVVDLHAEPKGSSPRSRDKACWHVGSGKQVQKRDREVGSVINVWGLLGRGLKGIDRNRRVSSSLSPIFYLFLIPSGILYHKVQHLLAYDESSGQSHSPLHKHRRPGLQHPNYGIPVERGADSRTACGGAERAAAHCSSRV